MLFTIFLSLMAEVSAANAASDNSRQEISEVGRIVKAFAARDILNEKHIKV